MYIVLRKLNFISLFPKYLHTMVTYIESLASKFQWHFDIMEKVSTEDERLRGSKMVSMMVTLLTFLSLTFRCLSVLWYDWISKGLISLGRIEKRWLISWTFLCYYTNYLLKSNRALIDLGTSRSGQVRKWNWVTVLVSLVCRFFR